MVNSIKKIISIIIICQLLIFGCEIYSNITYASSADSTIGDLEKFNGNGGSNSERLRQKAEKILGVIQVVGIVVSVAILMVLGIKYMLGSVEEKSQYKETMIPYLIGAALVFSGTSIPQIIYKISKNI